MATAGTLSTSRWAPEEDERFAFWKGIRAIGRTVDQVYQSLQREDSGPIDDDDILASIEAGKKTFSSEQAVWRLYRQFQATLDAQATDVPEGRWIKSIARQKSEEKSEQLYQKLMSFSSLGERWDGYAADPPSQLACENAREFIQVLSLAELFPSRCKPSVVGGVGVTLKNGGRRIYVEFYNNGSVHALKSDGTGEPVTERVGAGYSQYLRFIQGIMDYLNA